MTTTKYFEDFHLGDTFHSPATTVTDAHFLCFARLTGDQHPLHYDDAYAKTSRRCRNTYAQALERRCFSKDTSGGN